MRKITVFAAGVVIAVVLSAMALAQQNSDAPVARQQAKQPEPLAGQGSTGSQPVSGKPKLSKHNKAMIEQAEQMKLRQIEIDKERAADPQSK